MATDDKSHAQALVERLLREAQTHTREGALQDALTSVRKAKALDQTNVFILGLEDQIERLQEESEGKPLASDQKEELLANLPALVEQGIARHTALETPDQVQSQHPETEEDRRRRAAAERWLKNQFFQRAHTHVKKSQYQRALQDIQRVLLLDGQDRFARGFEDRIRGLLELQKKHESPPESPPAEAPVAAEPEQPKTLYFEEPAEEPALPEPPALEPVPEQHSSSRYVIIGLVLTLIAIILGFLFLWKRDTTQQQVRSPRVIEVPADDTSTATPPDTLSPQ
jgi:hypothetical protein